MAKFRRKRKNNAKILLILILAIIAIAIMLFFKTDMFRNQFYPKKYSEYVSEFSEKYNVDVVPTVIVFKNGKVARVPLKAYETKTNRKKLSKAYSDKSPIVAVLFAEDNCDIMITASNNRKIQIFHSTIT